MTGGASGATDALHARILRRAAAAGEQGAARFDAALDEQLASHPDPRRALVQLDRYLEAAYSPTSVIEDFLQRPALFALFIRLTGVSGFAADALVREPHLLQWLADSGVTDAARSAGEMRLLAREVFDAFRQPERRIAALTRFQRRELLRIIVRDLTCDAALSATTTELSHLADAIVDVLLAHALDTVAERFGRPVGTPVAVIALGKLGGGELNYSSDIDLMAVYGEFREDASGQSTHDLVVRAIELLVRHLTEQTADGFFYRTDFRLRPDGGAGALALSLQATLAYYESRGAAWERQMLMKARAIAGDRAFGEDVIAQLVPFVHPRTSFRTPLETLADVEQRVMERWHRTGDVKHFRGGIRSIEFAVQALQIIHAAADKTLRTGSTLRAIEALHAAGRLDGAEAHALRTAYERLRRIEHMLQLEAFEQTHTLPGDEGMPLLAWKCGMDSPDEFLAQLGAVRADVMRVFDAIFGPARGTALQAAAEATLDVHAFDTYADPAAARTLVRAIAEGRARRPHPGALRDRARRTAGELAPLLADAPDPLGALRCIEQLVDRAPAPAQIIAYLEHAGTRRFLLTLASFAPAQLRRVSAMPLVLDAVFSARAADSDPVHGLALHRLTRETDALGRHLLGDLDIAGFAAECSDTADVIVRHLYERSVGVDVPFAVIALGKYGGREITPGSDLDVVFVAVPDAGFTLRDAQDAARNFLDAFRPAGTPEPLYEVDARLRPEGRSSPLAATLDACETYFAHRASLWERQALLRARAVAGREDIARRLLVLYDRAAAVVAGMPHAAADIRAMRQAMEPANRFRARDHFDVKLSDGGLVDAEFAAQSVLLLRGEPIPSAHAGTFAALSALSADDAFGPMFTVLSEQYAHLRRVQLLLRLLIDTPSNLLPADDAQAAVLARACGFGTVTAFRDDVAARRRTMREAFTAVMERL